jgi:hypothetical protein
MHDRLTNRLMIIALCLLFIILGIREMIIGDIGLADLFLVWFIDILMIYVCICDARQNDRVILQSFRWIMFFTWPLSIIIYYVWYYRFKGVLRILLWGAIFWVCWFLGGLFGYLLFLYQD